MNLLTKVKIGTNKLLAFLNMKVETLTAERVEMKRLGGLQSDGHFQRPIFPVLSQFADCDASSIFTQVAAHEKRFEQFAAAPQGGEGYSFANDYFTSPDAEVLYAIVNLYKPRRIIEVGSGNSTLLFRQAIVDAGLSTELLSIDPFPRRDIDRYSDKVIRDRVEDLDDLKSFLELGKNDILLIDSSHEIKAGNDVLFLFLRILPMLQSGVLVHIHDIFLPYEYPREWLMIERWNWTEQYLVQALLQGSMRYDVLWAGYYLQRHLPDFNKRFVHWRGENAKSLWLRKR